MKKLIVITILLFSLSAYSQVDLSKVDKSNTWFKVGINAALPIGDLAKGYSAGLGLDASVQFLETKASGIGLKAGYINYFGKDPVDNMGLIPLAVLYRFYPESTGFFAGLEVGYAVILNNPVVDGGVHARPHLGWHTDDWNFYGYYDYTSIGETGVNDFQAIGIGVTRNIKIK